MTVTIATKGNSIVDWKPVGELVVNFRTALTHQVEYCGSHEAEALLTSTRNKLNEYVTANDADGVHLSEITVQASAATSPEQIKLLIRDYFSILYEQFGRYRSAPAFFQLSSGFLPVVAGALVRHSFARMGAAQQHLPEEWVLLVMGPPGRHEFTPFCPLRLMVTNDSPSASSPKPFADFCRILHESFADSGLFPFSDISPGDSRWRRSGAEWFNDITQVSSDTDGETLIDLLRLVDLLPLWPLSDRGEQFRVQALHHLQQNKTAQRNLIERLQSLSNGLSLVGALRLEKSGEERGLFRLFDHGMLPLAATVTAMSLMYGIDAATTPQRIRGLLGKWSINVDSAERLLSAWHTLNELRLSRERSLFPALDCTVPMYLNPHDLSANELESLKESLEDIATIQRQTPIMFEKAGE